MLGCPITTYSCCIDGSARQMNLQCGKSLYRTLKVVHIMLVLVQSLCCMPHQALLSLQLGHAHLMTSHLCQQQISAIACVHFVPTALHNVYGNKGVSLLLPSSYHIITDAACPVPFHTFTAHCQLVCGWLSVHQLARWSATTTTPAKNYV